MDAPEEAPGKDERNERPFLGDVMGGIGLRFVVEAALEVSWRGSFARAAADLADARQTLARDPTGLGALKVPGPLLPLCVLMPSPLKGLRYAERPDGFFDVRVLPTDRLERLSAQQLAARIENEQPEVIEGFFAGFLRPLAGPPPALIAALSARGLQLVEDGRACPRCHRPCPRCGRT